MRFSREFERQADIEGSHIMARAGYDPRDMANMFKTIAKQGGAGGPQWLSDHPDPGDRSNYITREAQMLRVENPIRDTRAFEQVKAHLRQLPPAPTTEQATKSGAGRPTGTSGRNVPAPTGRVEPPSSSFRTYNEGNLFQVSVPANWQEIQSNSSVTFAPSGAYGQANGQTVFTHGVEFGMGRNETHDLQTATDELIQSLANGNPGLSRASGYQRVNVARRNGLRTVLRNRSEVTGQDEAIQLVTTQMQDGNLFYAIGVAPGSDFPNYQRVFDKIIGSLQLASQR
jgi:hypothetical protein